MPRPRRRRRICFSPDITYFSPPSASDEVILTLDEFEALRISDFLDLDQATGASRMNISQPTFNRLLSSARKKIAEALVQGKAIRIQGGNYKLVQSRRFVCLSCGYEWDEPYGTGRPGACPKCGSPAIRRLR